MNYSNGASFGASVGNAADHGDSRQARDGSRPASAAWMFTVLVWRI